LGKKSGDHKKTPAPLSRSPNVKRDRVGNLERVFIRIQATYIKKAEGNEETIKKENPLLSRN